MRTLNKIRSSIGEFSANTHNIEQVNLGNQHGRRRITN